MSNLLKSTPHQQVTPLSEGWWVVHHTRYSGWWAVRHQCDDGVVWGMVYKPGKTWCHGCEMTLPSDIDGFMALLEWEK